MKNKKEVKWRRLDNSAKIFPISTGKKYSTVFRFSVVLNENIDELILEKAVNKVLINFNYFKVKMKAGFFWYYFEENEKKVKVEKELDYPCKYIDPDTNNGYLFKVTYFENKINIDIFHALTDGNSGKEFFKEIVYTYIELKHKNKFKEELRTPRKLDYDVEDDYIKNYDKNLKSETSSKKAYILKGRNINLGAIGVVHEIINLDQLKNISKESGATITQYLTAVLIYAIYSENYLKSRDKKPIKVCIPVDLRKYFLSKTVSNFFSYITLQANLKKEKLANFDDILEFVKEDFKEKLKEEAVIGTMSGNVKIGTNIATRMIPLPLKKMLVRLSYIEIRKYTTITFSNIGRMGIIGKYQDYIKYFMMLIAPEPVEKIKCSACTFSNKLVFTFTTILNDIKIEKFFYEFLKNKNIDVEIESNGVLDDIS